MKLCILIADVGATEAAQYKASLIELIESILGREVSQEENDAIFKTFSFMNWAYANGIWSNLNDTKLRRDLMDTSINCVVTRIVYELDEDKSEESIALSVPFLDKKFRKVVLGYKQRMVDLAHNRIEPNRNTPTLYSMELIQKQLKLTEEQMNQIIPQFLNHLPSEGKVEKIAMNLNKFDGQNKKGFFSRLFGS